MNWRSQHYQEEADLLGVVRGLMGCNPANYEPILDVEILHYIEVARDFRDAFKDENAQQDGTRTESECADAVRIRLQLPLRDELRFYPGLQLDYRTPERIFLLACVALTGSREGARLVAGIALPRRNLKGLQTHINQCLLHSSVPNS